MANTMKLKVVTPDRSVYEGMVEGISVKTVDGYEGFLPGHSRLVTLLDTGVLSIKEPGGNKKEAEINGGFIDVKDEVLVFTDQAEWLEK